MVKRCHLNRWACDPETGNYCAPSCAAHLPGSKRFRKSRYERLHRDHNRARDKRRDAHDIEFVAIDGEGITINDEHHYVLMCATGCPPLHKNGERLTTEEIFDWLYKTVFRYHPNAAFVGFFLGYDFTQWFCNLPRDRGKKLFLKEEIEKRQRTTHPHLPPFPVYWEREGLEFDLLGDVRFKIRPFIEFVERKARKERKEKPTPWMCSFVTLDRFIRHRF